MIHCDSRGDATLVIWNPGRHVEQEPVDGAVQDVHLHGGVQPFVGSRQFRDQDRTRQHDAIFAQATVVQRHDDRDRTVGRQQFEPRLVGRRIVLPLDHLGTALDFDVAGHGELAVWNCRPWADATADSVGRP